MLVLRDFVENDIDRLVSILNDAEVIRFLSTKLPTPYTVNDALWWINEGSKGDLVKAISYKDILVGCIGVNCGEFEYQYSGEVGYWLAKEYWRKGIAYSALQQLSECVFSNTDIVRLFASVFSGNQPSIQLLLKSGFKQEAVLQKAIFKDGHFYNNHVFAKLR